MMINFHYLYEQMFDLSYLLLLYYDSPMESTYLPLMVSTILLILLMQYLLLVQVHYCRYIFLIFITSLYIIIIYGVINTH